MRFNIVFVNVFGNITDKLFADTESVFVKHYNINEHIVVCKKFTDFVDCHL